MKPFHKIIMPLCALGLMYSSLRAAAPSGYQEFLTENLPEVQVNGGKLLHDVRVKSVSKKNMVLVCREGMLSVNRGDLPAYLRVRFPLSSMDPVPAATGSAVVIQDDDYVPPSDRTAGMVYIDKTTVVSQTDYVLAIGAPRARGDMKSLRFDPKTLHALSSKGDDVFILEIKPLDHVGGWGVTPGETRSFGVKFSLNAFAAGDTFKEFVLR